jgi:hypothetical protein
MFLPFCTSPFGVIIERAPKNLAGLGKGDYLGMLLVA